MPDKESAVKQKFEESFPFLADKVKVVRARRISLETPYSDFARVFDFAVNTAGFNTLCTITGLDENEKLSLIYHLADSSGIVVNIKTSVPKENPEVNTITSYFTAAALYEREMMDLLGIKVSGLPEGKRYPLPDGWPEGSHPLRKDWKA